MECALAKAKKDIGEFGEDNLADCDSWLTLTVLAQLLLLQLLLLLLLLSFFLLLFLLPFLFPLLPLIPLLLLLMMLQLLVANTFLDAAVFWLKHLTLSGDGIQHQQIRVFGILG